MKNIAAQMINFDREQMRRIANNMPEQYDEKPQVTGATVTSINQAAAKMARTGILVIDGKVWRTVYYRFATREEREGKVSTNLIFKECRQSAAMKRVLAFYRGNFQ